MHNGFLRCIAKTSSYVQTLSQLIVHVHARSQTIQPFKAPWLYQKIALLLAAGLCISATACARHFGQGM